MASLLDSSQLPYVVVPPYGEPLLVEVFEYLNGELPACADKVPELGCLYAALCIEAPDEPLPRGLEVSSRYEAPFPEPYDSAAPLEIGEHPVDLGLLEREPREGLEVRLKGR